jgi:cupin superfamily acireductone dioxygenase involved in methionine salvage
MHDETFFVTKGQLRFTVITADDAKKGINETKDIDCKTGDYVIVPTKSIHTFS